MTGRSRRPERPVGAADLARAYIGRVGQQVTSKRRRIQQGLGRLASDGQGLTRAAMAGAAALGSPERAAARPGRALLGTAGAVHPAASSARPILLRIHRSRRWRVISAGRFSSRTRGSRTTDSTPAARARCLPVPTCLVMAGGERPYLQVMGEAIGERSAKVIGVGG